MAIAVYSIGLINLIDIVLLPIQILAGIAIYLILSLLSRRSEFTTILDLVKSKLRKNSAQ